MPKIYLLESLKLNKEKFLINQLLRAICKHANGNNNLIDVYSPGPDYKVLKAYLFSGRIRAVILYKISKKIYVPFLIAKKESKIGRNISKYSQNDLENLINKSTKEIFLKKYEELDILPEQTMD